jgi:hypothetical protein
LIAYQDAIKWLNDNNRISFKTGKLEAKDISLSNRGERAQEMNAIFETQ